MAKFIHSLSLASVISVASLNSAIAEIDAYATDDDELFLPEQPLAIEQLQAARGGFPVGGFVFDISVIIAPIEITPIVDEINDAINDVNSTIDNVVDDIASTVDTIGASAADPVATPADPLSNTVAPAMEPIPDAVPIEANDVSQVPAAPPALSASTLPATATTETPATDIPVVVNDVSIIAGNSGQPEAPAQTGSNDMTLAAQNNAPAPQSPELEDHPQNISTQNFASGPAPSNVTATDDPEPNTSMSFGLAGPTEGTTVAAILPDQILQVINNNLDNVLIARNIDINVTVPNFNFQLGLIMSGTLTSQVIVNHTFLGSLQ